MKIVKSAANELQKALFECLTKHPALSKKITGVFDSVEQGKKFPYIVIGEDTAVDFSSKTNPGEDYTCTIHVWSDKNGNKETKEIQSLVLQAISTANLDLGDEFYVVHVRRELQQILDDPSGLKHGVQRIRFIIKQY
jgi:N-acetyl-beta-hexosaminidase